MSIQVAWSQVPLGQWSKNADGLAVLKTCWVGYVKKGDYSGLFYMYFLLRIS